jgi:dienelactone hydrolase
MSHAPRSLASRLARGAVRTFRWCAALLCSALLTGPTIALAQSHFTRTNPPGRHPVGLRVIEQYDLARGYRSATDPFTGRATSGTRARPIQTLIWYPAKKGTGLAMTAGNYLRLGATPDDFGQAAAERARLESDYVNSRVSALTTRRAQIELAALMTARRDAIASEGRFPVVIYAPSYRGPAFENADLCEFLASHGYLVIASPSIGQSPYGMTDDLEGIETQVGDIQYLIGYSHSLPQADIEHLAVLGYSWGGLANVMAAAKDPRIHALVSLDGSVRSYPDVIEQSRFLTPDRVTAPMLYVAATPRQIEDLPADMNRERSFLNRMRYSDLYRVTLAPYVHPNFSVMFGQRFVAETAYGNYDQDELSVANGWIETYVRRFLDTYAKGDSAGRAFLETPASQTGAPAHLLTVYRVKGDGDPPTRTAFAAALATDGFERASTIYQTFRTRAPGFTLSDDELNAWGYTLLRGGQAQQAVALFRLNTELHADSWNAFDSLGEGYASSGNREAAIVAYRKSLALNPGNANAVTRLTALGVQP